MHLCPNIVLKRHLYFAVKYGDVTLCWYHKFWRIFKSMSSNDSYRKMKYKNPLKRFVRIDGYIKWSSTMPNHTLTAKLSWMDLIIVAWGFSSSQTRLFRWMKILYLVNEPSSLNKTMRGYLRWRSTNDKFEQVVQNH